MTDYIAQLAELQRLRRGETAAISQGRIDPAIEASDAIDAILDRLAAGPDVGDGWLPIDRMPDGKGEWLVYMPERPETKRQQVMTRGENGVSIIGGGFAFDLPRPTMFCPLPPPPKEP